MPTVRAILLWVLSASAALAGCGKTEWWRRSDPSDAPTAPADPNLAATPEELAALRIENAALRAQVEDLKARDRQLSDQLRDLRILNEGYERQVRDLADAPGERDRYKAQAEAMKALVERLQEDIRALKNGPPPATRPAGANPARPAPSSAPPGE